MEVTLRDVTDADLPILFEHQRDPVACEMAAFPSRDYDAFMAHWRKVRADDTALTQAIVVDGAVAGYIASFMMQRQREVGYWLGREWWGRGLATEALRQLLQVETRRPLHAHVAKGNAGSLRVLQKCGFVIAGEDSCFNDQLGRQVDEHVLVLA
jgi:RimJ/RimL family protein N-acetyltransferase